MYTKSDTQHTTKFNISLASLERLNDLLRECNYYSRLAHKRDFVALKNWYVTLVAVYKEISAKLTVNEIKTVVTIFEKRKKLQSVRKLVQREEYRSFVVDNHAFTSAIDLFDSIELRLRKLADIHGMLLIDEDTSAHDSDAEW